tara:strand:+ start:743 stop:1219 length:477 start_codon:yes stop_codon:yes gene_type:complete
MVKKISAVCVLHQNKNNIEGIIRFSQNLETGSVKIAYDIKGLDDGEHGIHIHKYGDLTDGCSSACSHFNPYNKNHGGRKSTERHVGDLGNLISEKGVCKGYFYDKLISLNIKKKNSIIGRSVIIHDKRDDLGKGGNLESLRTGNAGKRLACGVIGLSA